ncbi:unnamed protein product, partial [Urochloa humidicola]
RPGEAAQHGHGTSGPDGSQAIAALRRRLSSPAALRKACSTTPTKFEARAPPPHGCGHRELASAGGGHASWIGKEWRAALQQDESLDSSMWRLPLTTRTWNGLIHPSRLLPLPPLVPNVAARRSQRSYNVWASTV